MLNCFEEFKVLRTLLEKDGMKVVEHCLLWKTVFPDAFEDPGTHVILFTLLYRITIANNLFETCAPDASSWISPGLCLFIDTHIELLTACISVPGDPSDTYLMQDTHIQLPTARISVPGDPSDAHPMQDFDGGGGPSLFWKTCPTDDRFMHGGDLPDISALLYSAPYSKMPKQKTRKVKHLEEALLHLLSKIRQQKCASRGFAAILRRYMSDFPMLMAMFSDMLECSLLGNYHFPSKETFSIQQRVKVRQFVVDLIETPENLLKIVVRYPHFARYVIREFNAYQLSFHPALEKMFEDTTHWKAMRSCIRDTMEDARRLMKSRQHLPLHSWDDAYTGETLLSCIDASIKEADKHRLGLIDRSRNGSALELFCTEARQLYNHQFHEQTPSTLDPPESENRLDGKTVENAKFLGSIHPVQQHWALSPASLLGIGKDSFVMLVTACYNFEQKGGSESKFKQLPKVLLHDCPRDFHAIRVYAEACRQRMLFVVFPLDANTTSNQEMALRASQKILPWQDLHPNSDLRYFCDHCLKWKAPVMETIPRKPSKILQVKGLPVKTANVPTNNKPGSNKTPQKNNQAHAEAKGHRKVIYREVKDALFCTSKWPPAPIRFLLRSTSNCTNCQDPRFQEAAEKYSNTGNNGSKKGSVQDPVLQASKIVSQSRKTNRCGKTPLVGIHMLGNPVKLGKHMYLLCSGCGTLCLWNFEGFSGGCYLCSHCWEQQQACLVAPGKCFGCGLEGPGRKVAIYSHDFDLEEFFFCTQHANFLDGEYPMGLTQNQAEKTVSAMCHSWKDKQIFTASLPKE